MQRAIGPAALIGTFDHKLYQLRHIIQRAIGPAVSFGQSKTHVLCFLGDIGPKTQRAIGPAVSIGP